MEITKETLEATKAQILAEREQKHAELNFIQGKLLAVEGMIAHLNLPEPDTGSTN